MKGILRFFALPLILLAFGISLNGCGGGSSSTFLPVAPGTPSSVSATPGDSKVIVGWNAVSGASSYNIYYATTPGVTKSTGIKIENATSPYEISGLTNGTPYYFVVTAVNAFGESSESTEVSATPIPIPAKPKGSSAYSGNNQAVVYCQSVDSATSYNLYYSTTTGVNTTTYTEKITGITNPYTLTGLSNGTTYYFVITAVNAAGEGPISSETTATPSATQPQPPPSPAGVLVTAGIASITVDWYTCYTATILQHLLCCLGIDNHCRSPGNGSGSHESHCPRWPLRCRCHSIVHRHWPDTGHYLQLRGNGRKPTRR